MQVGAEVSNLLYKYHCDRSFNWNNYIAKVLNMKEDVVPMRVITPYTCLASMNGSLLWRLAHVLRNFGRHFGARGWQYFDAGNVS